ncbi:iron ABC transporter permease [Bacillus glycinifermentans]|uniref:Iron ABC transporter permease n=1 Tax=Bacillus glycinifermentans TaxID=1664069 RepID=A0ABU6H583_9BACI|nr:iron ABC transporter permease [Bacillus glycinifermentans]MEC0485844.1 iron ABC transporter permease [Bacillus glycinifermentans]MEC0495670.1 iron ABC transporter permease [Bacillus glycinifermentans]MEC0542105.1 iron ABC transporter permease [Bacillus glycinifermentans]
MGKGGVSFLIGQKALFSLIVLLLVTVFAVVVSAGVGERFISPGTVMRTFFGIGDPADELIIMSFRMPRILVALFAGICLAASGAVLQGLIRNPLASPDVIGVTGGAAVAVVLFLMLFSDGTGALTVSIGWLPVAAFIGAALAGMLVYFLSYKNGASTFRLILIGIGFSMLAQSLTTLFMMKGPIYRISQANVWITGSVYGSNWQDVYILIPTAFILLLVCAAASRSVNIQTLGEELATGAGSSVQRNRFLLLLLSTALAGIAVAFAGTVGFVGLMAPHIARRLVGSSFGALLPVASLIGGLLVLTADIIGRTLFSPVEVPAGVFTAAIGAPYFIYLLYKSRNQ